MSTAVMTTNRLELASVADGALKAGAKFWFVVTMISQLVFAFTVASFYSLTAARGDYHKWNFTGGYTPGYSMGNTAVVMHVVSAAIVMLSGWVQLIPQVRSHFPGFHRWNGRIYMLTAVTLSVAGLYMTWFRGSVGGIASHMGSTVNAILIWVCAAMALRYALARDFRTHRRWALRFFLVVSASWFFRLGFFVAFLIFRGPFRSGHIYRAVHYFHGLRPIFGASGGARDLLACAGFCRRRATHGYGDHALCSSARDGCGKFRSGCGGVGAAS
jgi:hypothetical protein